jgi:DNA-binding CsgD family transcriptional regulator
VAQWPLVGRDPAALLRELDGGGAGMLLRGEAGVGKTRLAEALLDALGRRGRPTARAVGNPAGRTIPLGAIAHLLPVDIVSAEGDRAALFHQARASIDQLAGGARLALHIDDVDQLDELSQAVLVPLLVAGSVQLIGTIRSGRDAPTLEGLVKDGFLRAVTVDPLDRQAVERLLEEVLGGLVDAAAVDELHQVSRGNPLVLRELVDRGRADGHVVEAGAWWRIEGRLRTTPRVEELLAERLGQLDDEHRRAMELMAVAGEIGIGVLEQLHAPEVLEDLEEAGLLQLHTSERRLRLGLFHPLYGEVLRSGLAGLRARKIRRDLADAVEGYGARRREDLLRVAEWRLDAGGVVDPAGFVHAARLALADRDVALAERLVGAAESARPTIDGGRVRAEVLFRLDRTDEVEELCVELLARQDLTAEQRAAIARRRAQNLFFGRGTGESLLVNGPVIEQLEGTPQRDAVAAHQATLLAAAARPGDALALAESAAAAEDPRARIEAAMALTVCRMITGRAEAALATAERALEELTALEPVPGLLRPGSAVVNRLLVLSALGRFDEAEEALAAAGRSPTTGGPLGMLYLARIALLRGRLVDVERLAGSVAAATRAAGQNAMERWALALVAHAQLWRGRIDEPAATLERVSELEARPAGRGLFHADVFRAHAALAAARGDLAAARSATVEAVEWAADGGMVHHEIVFLHDVARFGGAPAVAGRIGDLGARVDGAFLPALVDHVTAVAAGDADLLLTAALRLLDLGCRVYAAEAFAELGDVLRAGGDQRGGAAAAQRAGALADELGGLSTPALARAEAIVPLTRREREVALLAANGMASKEIARRLHLSVRTVDNHLQSSYAKLGLAGREELPGALGLGGASGPE